MKRKILILPAVFVLLSGYGCSLKTGKPIPEVQVQAITPGKTTKDALFTQFGAPAAIMGKGEIAVINTPAVWSGFAENRYTYSFSSDTFFELFPAAGAPDEYRRVYYFCYTVSYKYPVWYIIYCTSERMERRRQTVSGSWWTKKRGSSKITPSRSMAKASSSEGAGENKERGDLHRDKH